MIFEIGKTYYVNDINNGVFYFKVHEVLKHSNEIRLTITDEGDGNREETHLLPLDGFIKALQTPTYKLLNYNDLPEDLFEL